MADASPYGLHRLAEHGYDVWFRPESVGALRNRAEGFLEYYTHANWVSGLVPAVQAPWTPDVLLAWSEKDAIPALAREKAMRRGTPMLAGAIWLTDSTHKPMLDAARRWLSRAAGLFVVSAAQSGRLREIVGPGGPAISFIPFGVDAEYFSRPAALGPAKSPLLHGIPEGADIIMSTGNDYRRDYATLLEAFEMIPSRPYQPQPHLVIATTRHEVRSDNPRVHIGGMSTDELRDSLARANVFAVASRPNLHVSGITATLEAMSMGLPVVMSRTPGLEDYLQEGRSGTFVESGDATGMARAITNLLRDPSMAAAFGERGRYLVRTEFNVDRLSEHLAGLLDTI